MSNTQYGLQRKFTEREKTFHFATDVIYCKNCDVKIISKVRAFQTLKHLPYFAAKTRQIEETTLFRCPICNGLKTRWKIVEKNSKADRCARELNAWVRIGKNPLVSSYNEMIEMGFLSKCPECGEHHVPNFARFEEIE